MQIEVDSDSDFAPGAYVPEVKPKKKARNSSAGPSTRKRRRIDSGTTINESKSKKSRTSKHDSRSSTLTTACQQDIELPLEQVNRTPF